jgi:branched-chain amino acid transport system permease protein
VFADAGASRSDSPHDASADSVDAPSAPHRA